MLIVGIDPGSVHCGVSVWEGLECIDATELTPSRLADALLGGWMLDGASHLCIEDYVSEGGFGSARSGTETAMMLGLAVWVARVNHAIEPILVNRATRDNALVRLRAAGYPFVGMGKGDHARDAEAVVVAGMKYGARAVSARAGTAGTIDLLASKTLPSRRK